MISDAMRSIHTRDGVHHRRSLHHARSAHHVPKERITQRDPRGFDSAKIKRSSSKWISFYMAGAEGVDRLLRLAKFYGNLVGEGLAPPEQT